MPSIEQYYTNESDYLKAIDLSPGNKYKMTITGNNILEFDDNGIKKRKIAIHFKETTKRLTLNKTNGTTIAHVYGDEVNNWVGKNIFIYNTKVSYGDKMVDAIRVEMPLVEGEMQPNVMINEETPLNDFTQNTGIISEGLISDNESNKGFDDDIPF